MPFLSVPIQGGKHFLTEPNLTEALPTSSISSLSSPTSGHTHGSCLEGPTLNIRLVFQVPTIPRLRCPVVSVWDHVRVICGELEFCLGQAQGPVHGWIWGHSHRVRGEPVSRVKVQ